MLQIPKFTEDKSQNHERALQYMVKTLQEENEQLHALLDEKQRVLDAFKIEYIIDLETQQICGRSKKILELQNKLEEAQDKLKNVESYINRYTGLYFDEQATNNWTKRKLIMAFENLFDPTEEEHWSKDGAICPYCGYINDANNSDGYLYQQSTETYTCEHCNKKFEVQVDWTFDWTTKKIED